MLMTGALEPTGGIWDAGGEGLVWSGGGCVEDRYWTIGGSDGSLRCLELCELNIDDMEDTSEVSLCFRAVNGAIAMPINADGP